MISQFILIVAFMSNVNFAEIAVPYICSNLPLLKWPKIGYSIRNHEICYSFTHTLAAIPFLCAMFI